MKSLVIFQHRSDDLVHFVIICTGGQVRADENLGLMWTLIGVFFLLTWSCDLNSAYMWLTSLFRNAFTIAFVSFYTFSCLKSY